MTGRLYCSNNTLVPPTHTSQPRIRKALLGSFESFDASLFYYPAGLSQPEHDHASSQFSAVLAGSLVERIGGTRHCAGPGQVAAKLRGTVHSDCYGPNGAVLLSFRFRCEETAENALDGSGGNWRTARASGPALARNLACCLGDAGSDDFLWDVLSLVEPKCARARVPDWLRWVRAQLDMGAESPDIASLAGQAGVHRVHLSKQFTRLFGVTPSVYRQRQMALRALRGLVDDHLAPAAAAHDAGFADQSHMARAIRAAFGTTPRRLAALLAN